MGEANDRSAPIWARPDADSPADSGRSETAGSTGGRAPLGGGRGEELVDDRGGDLRTDGLSEHQAPEEDRSHQGVGQDFGIGGGRQLAGLDGGAQQADEAG